MTKPSPLRRLSVALKLREAYDPQPQPVTPAADDDTSITVSKFLQTTKDKFLNDVKEDPIKAASYWTVVMGNEAADLDSIASSIGYAWILSEIHKKPAIPLIQSQHSDLSLRPENIYALKLVGLSSSLTELLTLTDTSPFSPFPSQNFALVDHNLLGPSFSLNNPSARVVSIIDHHEDEGLYRYASPRIILPAGSCASRITGQFPEDPSSPPPPDLALLLLEAILIDTNGLHPNDKTTDVDRQAALFLAPKSSIISNSIPPPSALTPIDPPNINPDALYEVQAIKDLTKALRDKKSDVSDLTAFDLLRRDYKEYTYTLRWLSGSPSSPSIKLGLSTVISGLKTWGTDGKLEEAAVRWMTERKITILGICTSYHKPNTKKIGQSKKNDKENKGKHKREQAWILLTDPELSGLKTEGLTVDVLAKRLFAGLEADESGLQLKKYKKFSKLEKGTKLPGGGGGGSRARAYKQLNLEANRKVIAPLVKKVLEGEQPAGAAGGSNKGKETA